MLKKANRNSNRLSRHQRVRNKITGTQERPRLNVYRSLTNIYAQLIDDIAGVTLVSASSLEEGIKGKVESTSNIEAANLVGKLLGEKAKEKGIEEVTFDRGGNIYHGRVKALAEGAREAGLKF